MFGILFFVLQWKINGELTKSQFTFGFDVWRLSAQSTPQTSGRLIQTRLLGKFNGVLFICCAKGF